MDLKYELPEINSVTDLSKVSDEDAKYTCKLPKDTKGADFRAKGAFVARKTRADVLWIDGLADYDANAQQNFVEALILATYRHPRFGLTEVPPAQPKVVNVVGLDEDLLKSIRARTEATFIARDLTNFPSSIKNPEWMAEQVKELSDIPGLEVKVIHYEELIERGFGAIVAVGKGSVNKPCLIHLTYTPEGADENTAHYALAGKGITFDTGGVNLKSRVGMEIMNTDMGGSAVVFGVIRAAAQLKLNVKIDSLMAMAENHIGGGAYRPADIVTSYSGKTMEIINTDAEGRVVLSDAIGYAALELKPDFIIDLATLTGSSTMTVGHQHSCFYSTHDGLAEGLIESGEASGEYLWRMPFAYDEYRGMLESSHADILQGNYDIGGGSVAAAVILEFYAEGIPWAHFDMAGPARFPKDYDEYVKGATGYGVRCLVEYFERNFANK
ncbi:MAG: leucyl aminopeptidase family protein [Micrococcaceae bacterium]